MQGREIWEAMGSWLTAYGGLLGAAVSAAAGLVGAWVGAVIGGRRAMQAAERSAELQRISNREDRLEAAVEECMTHLSVWHITLVRKATDVAAYRLFLDSVVSVIARSKTIAPHLHSELGRVDLVTRHMPPKNDAQWKSVQRFAESINGLLVQWLSDSEAFARHKPRLNVPDLVDTSSRPKEAARTRDRG